MFNINFSPGPSQISPEMQQDIIQAVHEKFLEQNHRADLFSHTTKEGEFGLRKYFNIPKDYNVFYTTSATEAMALSIRNVVDRNVYHFSNGSFSELFREISESLHKNVEGDRANWGDINDFNIDIGENIELIAMTYNETSTGCSYSMDEVKKLRKKYPSKLLAVDITSIAGIEEFEIDQADIWFFSLQKAFGLPSGMAVMIVSPRAYNRSLELQSQKKNTAALFDFKSIKKYMIQWMT